MGQRRRRYLGPANLLTREEIKEYRNLIDDIERQIKRSRTSREKKFELRKQVRNLRAELWEHKKTRKTKVHKEETYKGAES